MENETYSIVPPPELVEEWLDEPEFTNGIQMFEVVTITTSKLQKIAAQAANWGANRELDACCEWLKDTNWSELQDAADDLRADRRPKPPSLKEQSLALVDKIQGSKEAWNIGDLDLIRRTLETIND